ncbi:MAG TPA: hypothetical protein VHC47_09950 [Mucilaginibacter sp.]|nr:hypothetical protein [Mucilaginibacter sp.]
MTEIRTDLHEKIEHADGKQLEEIYGLLMNYFNGQYSIEERDTLTANQKEAINEGLAQAEAGEDEPVSELTNRLRSKYGLNG